MERIAALHCKVGIKWGKRGKGGMACVASQARQANETCKTSAASKANKQNRGKGNKHIASEARKTHWVGETRVVGAALTRLQ